MKMEETRQSIPLQVNDEPSLNYDECCSFFLAVDRFRQIESSNCSQRMTSDHNDYETEATLSHNEYIESCSQGLKCNLENIIPDDTCIKNEGTSKFIPDLHDEVDIKMELDIEETVLQKSDLALLLKIKPEPEMNFSPEKHVNRTSLAEVMNTKNYISNKTLRNQIGYQIASLKPLLETTEDHQTPVESSNQNSANIVKKLSPGYFSCDHCRSRYKRKQSLAKHIERTHNIKEIIRTVQRGESKCSEKIPNCKYTKRVYICSYCGKSHKLRHSFTNHIKKHNNSEEDKSTNICHHCRKSFTLHANLKRHINMFHSGIQETFACEFCGRPFRQKSNLKVHLNSHYARSVGYDEVNCSICSRKFNSRRLLQRHVDRVHSNRRNKQCQICKRKYISQQKFEDHVRKCSEGAQTEVNQENAKKSKYEHSNISYTCHLCSRYFRVKCTWQRHMRNHKRENNKLQCNNCDYKTFQKGHLVRHFRGAACGKFKIGEKHIKCEYCPKKFNSKKHMKMHLHRTCGIKNNKAECEICGRVMKRCYLSEHRKKEHPEIVFKCYGCNGTFGRRKDYLRKHIEKCYDF